MSSERRPLRKILYVALHYDYGKKEQGTSYEYNNFFKTLLRMVPEVVEFDFMTVLHENGRVKMNEMLLAEADRVQPDLVFFCLYTDEISNESIRKLSQHFTTFNWFCDDHWRFSNFSRHFAPSFSFISTTDVNAMPKYEKIEYRNALLTQWACNHFDYVPVPNLEKSFDVSFVGQPHGSRKRLMRFLARHGQSVETFGRGWKHGRVPQEEMIRIFGQSRINLNLSNASLNLHTIFRQRDQLKGRNFEIPGCGGFLLTNYVPDLERYYEIGKEIVCFENRRDLLAKIEHYLSHDVEREEIAGKGYQRMLHEHTYVHRFKELFSRMGFEV